MGIKNKCLKELRSITEKLMSDSYRQNLCIDSFHEKTHFDISSLNCHCYFLTIYKKVFINDHIEHCFDEKASSTPKKLKSSIEEFKEITKYLD